MKMPRLLLPVFLAAAMGMLTACGPSNTIHLQPYKAASSVLPGPTAPTISVVKFQDQRPDPSSLGKRRDGSYFTTMDNASEWFSRSIVDALSARGYQVSYAQSTAEAIKGKPAYLLTGTLNELKINEKSATSFDTSLTAKYTLADRNKKISMETLNASQTKTGLPGNSTVENLLRDTLTDVVNPMADKVAAKIGK